MTAYAHEFDAPPAPPLNMSKVAVGCASIATLSRRQQLRVNGGEVPLVTRFMPKRAAEMIGGSIYWIVKHQLVARQRILGFAQRGGRPHDRPARPGARCGPRLSQAGAPGLALSRRRRRSARSARR